MGIFDKLKFWKKEEEAPLELGKYPALIEGPSPVEHPEIGVPPGGQGITEMPHLEELSPTPPPPARGIGAPSAFGVAPQPFAQPQADLSRDMQVVQAKLDTLKALLDGINQRLERIERLQQRDEEAVPLAVRKWR